MDEVITLQLDNNVVESGSSEEIHLEPILNNFMDDYMRELRFCLVARIVNVQHAEELRVDVQPLNMVRFNDGTVKKAPLITNIPMFCYGTEDSAVLFTPKQGQTVMVLYSQLSLDEFKGGSIEPFESRSNRKMDNQDAIALPSIFPFNRSPNNKLAHFTDHSLEDLTVVHNLGTSRENKVILKRNGSIGINSPQSVDIDAPTTNVSKDMNVKGLLNVDIDVKIGGRSVKTFMETHSHNYTDDGNPMVTAPPNPTA
ncbi:Gp138 family membrane-puncturing spike protein [Acinetobacter baumannii]|uniref:Gp138 family membrane-puncturing spike protein n=1 Tax=Acinetobacter baumannii TaxID=470 RepID=UPI00366F5177